jgi:hypothetical protein
MHLPGEVMVIDKIEDDLSNQQDVLSDTLEILKDFYAKAYLSDYEVDWNANLWPWMEHTDAVVAGWTLTMSITQKFDYNRCVLPMTSFTNAVTWEELMELWRLEAQKWNDVKKQ